MSSDSSVCPVTNTFLTESAPAPEDSIVRQQVREPDLATGNEPLPQPVPIRKLRPWWGVDGMLHRVEQEGEGYIIAYAGKIGVILPDKPLRTKGGTIDLRNWVGQKVGLRNSGGVLGALLLPDTEEDRLQMRVWELEATLSAMIGQFANRHEDGCYYTNSTMILQQAFSHLGLQEGCTARDLLACCKDAAAKEARARAEASVKEEPA